MRLSEITALRALADALEELQAAERFAASSATPEARFPWISEQQWLQNKQNGVTDAMQHVAECRGQLERARGRV